MRLFLSVLFLVVAGSVHSQDRYYADKSLITFLSDGAIEDIKATNTAVTSILDVAQKEVAFLVKIRDFEFPKKLMQVHFNEKYLESEKYPKASFIGVIKDFDPKKEGTQQVTASGKLSIHGVTKEITVPGTIRKSGSSFILKSKFMIRLEDYNIVIPQIIWSNVAEHVLVELNLTYIPL